LVGKAPVLFCGAEDDYIPLPLDARDLKKKVERALRRRAQGSS
jgi:DNA-binding response OmpR family regulator